MNCINHFTRTAKMCKNVHIQNNNESLEDIKRILINQKRRQINQTFEPINTLNFFEYFPALLGNKQKTFASKIFNYLSVRFKK